MLNLSQIRALLRDLTSRIMSVAARGEVKRVNNSPRMQTVQTSLLKNELRDGLEHPENYGFTSHPKPGAECFALFFGGNRDHGIAIVVADRRFRVQTLAEGEVAIYDDLGQTVHLTRAGLQVTSPTSVTVTAPSVRIEGDLEVTGDVTDQADSTALSMADMRDTYNVHTHNENDSAPAPTGLPNGLMV